MKSLSIKLKYYIFNKRLYSIWHPIYWELIGKHRLKRIVKRFQSKALSVIADFDSVLSENNIEYYLMWGSMLGAIREHGFIKHDADIDVAIFSENDEKKIRSLLNDNGFFLEHDMTVDEGKIARHQCYRKNGVGIDIFWFYIDTDGKPFTCLYSPMEGSTCVKESHKLFGGVQPIMSKFPFERIPVRVPFENLMLPIPKNADEIMRIIYGDDYITPIPIGKYKPPRNPKYHFILKGKIAKRIDYIPTEK